MNLLQFVTLGLVVAGLVCVLGSLVWSLVRDVLVRVARGRAGANRLTSQEERLRSLIGERARRTLLVAGTIQLLSGLMLSGVSSLSWHWLLILGGLMVIHV